MFKSITRRILFIPLIIAWTVSPAWSLAVSDTLDVEASQWDRDSIRMILESPEFNRNLDRAILFQQRADSLFRRSVEMRKEAARIEDPVIRGQLQKKIMLVEDSIEVLRILAGEQFRILNESIPGYEKSGFGEESIHPFLVKDTVLNGITVYHYVLSEEFMGRLEEIRKPSGTEQSIGDSDVLAMSNANKESGESRAESPKKLPGLIISQESPYGEGNPFENDFTVPPGVFYRIQLAVYSNALPADHFGGLAPITTENIPERDLTRYFAGKFSRMNEARAALVRVKAMGYPDAFIVGYYNGAKASFSKLKALEN